MKRQFYLCILLMLSVFTAYAQSCTPWIVTIPGDRPDGANETCLTTDGGYVSACYFQSTPYGNGYAYFMKTDNNGNVVWTKIYGDDNEGCSANAIRPIESGNFIALAHYVSLPYNSEVIMKLDSNGDTLWVKKVPLGFAGHVEETSDHGFLITGMGLANNPDGIAVIKTDSSGNILWSKNYSRYYQLDDQGYYGIETSDGAYLFVGRSQKNYGAEDFDIYVVKTTTQGDTLWTRVYGRSGFNQNDNGGSLLESNDHNYMILGATKDSALLIKVDPNGNKIWEKTYDDWNQIGHRNFCQTSDGGFAFGTGRSLRKTDADGNQQWVVTAEGGTIYGDIVSVIQTADGCFVLGGKIWTGGDPSESDINIMKVDTNGFLTSIATTPAPFLSSTLFPNPFTTTTTLQFNLTTNSLTSLQIYDVNGKEIKTLLNNESLSAGLHSITIDAGNYLPGIYYYMLRCGEKTEVGKMVLMK